MRSSCSAYHPSLQALPRARRTLAYNVLIRNPAQEEAPGMNSGGFHTRLCVLLLGVLCGLVTSFRLVPVHDLPPGCYVLGSPVLVLQVVGMLPHVQPYHRRLAFHERCVLVRRGLYGE